MKHVTFAEKSLLMDDDAADSLIEYARLLAENGRADTVSLTAIGIDGNTVSAAFLLSSSSSMVVESTNTVIEPPDNTDAVAYMRERIGLLTQPVNVSPESGVDGFDYDVVELIDP